MVEAEETMRDIMKKMGFKTSTQVKTAYMNALIETGKAVAIKGGRAAGKAEKVKTMAVGKRGSIIIDTRWSILNRQLFCLLTQPGIDT